MEEVTRYPSKGSFQSRLKGCWNFGRRIVNYIGKWVLTFTLMFVFVLGLIDVYEVLVPENVPNVSSIKTSMKYLALQKSHYCGCFSTDDEKNWEALQSAIRILHQVCPPAASWVESTYHSGLITWEDECNFTYARHYAITGNLVINKEIFCNRNHGEIAVTLAHEFRHSRQHYTKSLKAAIYLAYTGKLQESIIETDAYDFERKVYIAIFQ